MTASRDMVLRRTKTRSTYQKDAKVRILGVEWKNFTRPAQDFIGKRDLEGAASLTFAIRSLQPEHFEPDLAQAACLQRGS
jgi:hypothetical protein